MRKASLIIGLVLALLLGSGPAAASPRAGAQKATDESLFREAKLLIFDKSWDAALEKIEELVDRFPSSPLAGQAFFYKGECLSALGGRQREALRAYKSYIRRGDAKSSLAEESEISIIDLAFELYEDGDEDAVEEIESRLDHEDKVVSYYAAYKLSLVSDKKAAAKAAPVLKRIVETETDPELLDRARIALLRVSPESLRSVEDRKPRSDAPKMLKIRIRESGRKEPVFSLTIPFSLADLALSALDEDDKAALRREGYDVTRIMRDLSRSKGSILRISGESGSVIEIWID